MSGLRSTSFSPMNHLEPRPPPRLNHVPTPTPFNIMAPPKPTVPDVSLIFGSSGFGSGFNSPLPSTVTFGNETPKAGTSGTVIRNDRSVSSKTTANTQKNDECSKYIHPSREYTNASTGAHEVHSDSNLSKDPSVMHNCSNSDDLKLLISMISKHEDYMVRMESQIKDLVDFQNNFLASLIKRGSSLHKEVQTERDEDCYCNNGEHNTLSSASSCSSESFQSLPQANSICKGPVNKSLARQNSEEKPLHQDSIQPKGSSIDSKSSIKVDREKEFPRPVSAESNRTNGREKTEDLSAILRDLQLPSVQENSMYSDASIRLLDLQEYHDDSINSNNEIGSPQIGPSVSAYGSYSSDDENSPPAVKPTVTFYRNVLGNVNRLLENDGSNEAQQNVHQHSTTYNSKGAHRNSHSKRTARNDAANYPLSSSSGGSSYSSDRNNGPSKGRHFEKEKGQPEDVGDVTKRYLETLGVQFTPSNEKRASHNPKGNQANVMIQQNVYNSIFIPTPNCVPIPPESLGSTSGQFNELANKYIPQEDLHQYKAVQESQKVGGNSTETTMYGMTSNHLSFATKQYLQRYGLVRPTCKRIEEPPPPPPITRPRNMQYTKFFNEPVNQSTDRILDLTALRNQPKLM